MTDTVKPGFLVVQHHLEAQSYEKMKTSETQLHFNLKVPEVHNIQEAFTTLPDDGLSYNDGNKVLHSIGTWAPDYSSVSSTYKQGTSYNGTTKKSTSSIAEQQFTSNCEKSKSKIENIKSFTCTECGKGLARKDKLVIHMRIHTGEKPYVCEICKKAFARRDKLVIHMNKLKHLTPSNLAPLSKRLPECLPSLLPQRKEMKDESTSPPPFGALMPSPDEWANTKANTHPSTDQSYCLVCHQTFIDHDQFMYHLRTHFRTDPAC